jgi:asparagine N-glycosylation enzyme membrane subunit Stt3
LPLVELSWQPELEDLIDALAARKKGGTRRETLLRAVIAITVLSCAFFLIVGAYQAAFTALVLLAYLVFLVVFLTIRRRSRSRRQLIASSAAKLWTKHEALRRPITAQLTPDGLELNDGVQATSYAWSAVSWVIETERSLVLIVRPSRSSGVNLFSKLAFALGTPARLPIPKRAAVDADQLTRLRALLVERAGGHTAQVSAANR